MSELNDINAQEHIFKESGGFHYIFLHPRKHNKELYNQLKNRG